MGWVVGRLRHRRVVVPGGGVLLSLIAGRFFSIETTSVIVNRLAMAFMTLEPVMVL